LRLAAHLGFDLNQRCKHVRDEITTQYRNSWNPDDTRRDRCGSNLNPGMPICLPEKSLSRLAS
jgi:hypothetical protein